MKLSVFTPTNNVRWLGETWRSLLDQSCSHWEWVLVPNGGAEVPGNIVDDDRVHVEPYPGEPAGVGALKFFACSHCRGDVLVELDHDDLLTPNALGEVAHQFEDRGVQFAYSNCAEFWDGTWKPNVYSDWWGWKSREYLYQGHELREMVAWPPGPWSLCRIWWAPNHVRAWRARAYWELEGHNVELPLTDDHDLCIRTYLRYGARGIRHIDRCLYLYRVREDSLCRQRSAEIQRLDQELYDKYVLPLALRWARDQALGCYDLGGALDPYPGLQVVDHRPDADVRCDLRGRWPLGDGTAGVVRASHILEHLPDAVHTMNELYRVLAPGGWALIEVPSTDGRGAFQDPGHCSFWNENSFWYYTRAQQARYIWPAYTGRFQVVDLRTVYPGEWWEKNQIPVVRAHLVALKPGYEEGRAGEIRI